MMTTKNDSPPVVVGIDGSDAAVAAALWAVDEAIERHAPLRLVHATGVHLDGAVATDVYHPELQYAESTLRAASSAVTATGKSVKVETDILWDTPDAALINESRNAAMICVGSVGIGWVARRVLGSTAASIAEHAPCPVVVVRPRADRTVADSPQWVVVGVDDREDNESIVTRAIEEARLRCAPVLAVKVGDICGSGVTDTEFEHRVGNWRQRYPNVHIYPISSHASLPRFLADNPSESVQLAVLGTANTANEIQQIIGPCDRALVPHAACSVMVAR